MRQIDWVQLWVLNALVDDIKRASLWDLIHRPGDQAGAYWAFPARPALVASVEERIRAVRTCIEDGLVAAYPGSWLAEPRFGPRAELTAEQCLWHDAQFLQDTKAVLTLPGHEKWEVDFQPDWTRFWSHESTVEPGAQNDDGGNAQILCILYASDAIFDELFQWLPTYWGLEPAAGWTEIDCHTTFQFQATSWKLLSIAKFITWQAIPSNVAWNKLVRVEGAGDFPPWDGWRLHRAALNAYIQARRSA